MIRTATLDDFENLLVLVEGYYADSPVPHRIDVSTLKTTIQELVTPENTLGGLLVATVDAKLVGFAFLLFGFDKRALRKTVVLNDLYVMPAFRRQGIARALITETFAWGQAHGAVRVTWQTRSTNTGAQKLYDQIGERETGWYHYFHRIDE
ncbi:GNAT family N-acetyltransferase [Lacticaseibacillus sp. GG6-2]